MYSKSEIDALNAKFAVMQAAKPLTAEAATQIAFEEGAFLAQEAIARTMLARNPISVLLAECSALANRKTIATDADYAALEELVLG